MSLPPREVDCGLDEDSVLELAEETDDWDSVEDSFGISVVSGTPPLLSDSVSRGVSGSEEDSTGVRWSVLSVEEGSGDGAGTPVPLNILGSTTLFAAMKLGVVSGVDWTTEAVDGVSLGDRVVPDPVTVTKEPSDCSYT